MLVTVKDKFALVGIELIVKNCWEKPFVNEHPSELLPNWHTGLLANRLLNVVWRDELIVRELFAGRIPLVKEKRPIVWSPTIEDVPWSEQVMIYGLIVTKPELVNAVDPADAVI